MTAGAHIIVQGMVQGVGFRYFVHARAARSGLTGFVRNLIDGGVEIRAEGDRSLIEELIKEVRIGPRAAQVTRVQVDWTEPTLQYQEFAIR